MDFPTTYDNHIYWMPDGLEIYPEYLTDANITVCPSDAQNLTKDRYEYCISDANQLPDVDQFLRLPGFSYLYIGYMTNEITADPRCSAGDPNAVLTNWNGLLSTMRGLRYPLGDNTHPEWMAWEQYPHHKDIENVVGADGQNHKVPLLREGIERFLITDINNPGGAATAQSSVPVMWDCLAWMNETLVALGFEFDSADQYSHVPGGANVLYMDGHVEFKKQGDDSCWPTSQDACDCGAWAT